MNYDHLATNIKDPLLLILGAAIAGAIIGTAKILNAIRDIITFPKIFKKTPGEIVEFKPEELDRESNPRFGFSFIHPKIWDRNDPENGDGNTFVHPKNSDIKILAWGHYKIDEKDLYDIVQDLLKEYEKLPGFNLIKFVQSGKHIKDWVESEQKSVEVKQQIEAWRIQYEMKNKKSRITIMELHTMIGDTHITLYCTAPSNIYPLYEGFYLYVASEFRILGSNAAPFARANVSGII